jgi:hypothetical protein
MKVFLSGCHGIGKTTFVNNLYIGKPLAKFVDTDVIPFEGIGRRQQVTRFHNMLEVIQILQHYEGDVIVDRSPFDFLVYNSIVDFYTAEDLGESLGSFVNLLIAEYEKLTDVKTVGILADYTQVKKNLRKRSRNLWNEDSENYNTMVWFEFKNFYNQNRANITPVEYTELDQYVKKLFLK